jgi:hypothetical protein
MSYIYADCNMSSFMQSICPLRFKFYRGSGKKQVNAIHLTLHLLVFTTTTTIYILKHYAKTVGYAKKKINLDHTY